MNTKAYYKIIDKIEEAEKDFDDIKLEIWQLRAEAKMLKKDNPEKAMLELQAAKIENSKRYIELESHLKTLRYCMNIMFYN